MAKKIIRRLLVSVSALLLIAYFSVGLFGNIGLRYGLYKAEGEGGAEGKWIADNQTQALQSVTGDELDEQDAVELGQNMKWSKRDITTEYINSDGETVKLSGEQKWGWSDNLHWQVVA